MKKVKFALLMLMAAILILPACKKGENDPFISLKSRDAKVTAIWKLTKIANTRTQVQSGNTSTTTYTFDGSSLIVTSSPGGSTTYTGSYEMEIIKDGTMTWNETYSFGGSTDVQSSTGTWQWMNSDKNKSVIILAGGNYFFTGGLWQIDRLASKELVLSNVGNDNDNGDTSTWDYKYTFEKQ